MRFFVTLKEKLFILRRLKRGDALPLLKYILFRLRLSPLFFLKRPYYRMRVWYAPYAFWLWTHQTKERSDEVFFSAFLQEGDVVVDAGAHLGTLTLTASARVGEAGKVIACEPHPRTFSFLSKNVQDNGCVNVILHNVAVGDVAQPTHITSQYVSDMNHITNEGGTRVQMVTLDELLVDEKDITLLKLDVEGYELQAMRGATQILSKIKVVYFESAARSFEEMGYSLMDIILFLKKHGFTTYTQDEDFQLSEVESGYITKQRYENLVALKDRTFYTRRLA
jgi:FkbM family methyltransferase